MTTLLPSLAITTALSATAGTAWQFRNGARPRNVTVQANFTYGSGGTTVDAYVQTTHDGGATWCDLCNFHFTTASGIKIFNLSSLTPVTTAVVPTDGSMASNTAQDGIIGSQLRVKYKSSGTYAGGTALQIDVSTDLLKTAPGYD